MTASLPELTRSVQAALGTLEKPLLAQFVDDQKIVAAHARGDEATVAKARAASEQERAQVQTVHDAVLSLFTAWKKASSQEGLAQDANAADKLLAAVQTVTTQKELVERRYVQLTGLLQSVEASGDAAVLAQAYAALQSWRDGAHEFVSLVQAFGMQEDRLALANRGSTFEGQLDASRFVDIQPFPKQGGVCTLEYAYDTRTKKRVVLKQYKHYIADGSDDLNKLRTAEQSFFETLTKTAKVAVPGAEKTIGFFFRTLDHGRVAPVIVTEFIEGQVLEAFRQRGIASEEFVLSVLQGVGPVIQALNAKGVFHGDLAPENIIVRPKGSETSYAVIDFHKLSMVHGSQSVMRNLYAPIEYLVEEGDNATNETTGFFALGRTILSLLLPDERFRALVRATINQELVLSDLEPELAKRLSPRLVHVIEKCVRPDRAERYHAWNDISYDLTSWKPGKLTLGERVRSARTVLGVSSGKWGAFWGALRGDTRIAQKQLVTTVVPVEPKPKPVPKPKALPAQNASLLVSNSPSFLLPANAVVAGPTGRFNGSVDDKGRRLLYPQEHFAILKRGFINVDPEYIPAAAEMQHRNEWTGVAIRRTQTRSFEVWYDPALIWDSAVKAYVPVQGQRGGSRFFFSTDLGSGWRSLSVLPPEFAFFWGDAYDVAKMNNAQLYVPDMDDYRWWPVARVIGDSSSPWSLGAYGIVNDVASRVVGAGQKSFGPRGVIAPVVEKTKWVLPIDKVQEGFVSPGEFTKKAEGLRKIGLRFQYPQEYFETLLYAETSKDPAYAGLLKRAEDAMEWCAVAFEWTDKGFFILWNPDLEWHGQGGNSVRYYALGHSKRLQVDASHLREGMNVLNDGMPGPLKALWGAAFLTAMEKNSSIDLRRGVWPVACRYYRDGRWNLGVCYSDIGLVSGVSHGVDGWRI